MAQRRLVLTTRGMVALGIVPFSALAGALLGAEELVLLSVAICTLVLCGLAQSAARARRARGNWRVTVALPECDVEVDRLLDLPVTVTTTGQVGSAPVWLEDAHHCWIPADGARRRARNSASQWPKRLPLPNPAQVLRVASLLSSAGASFGFPAPTGRRGVFMLRGMRLWSFDTFGLVARLVATGPTATVSVYPTPGDIELADALLHGEEGPHEAPFVVASARLRRDSLGDFSGLRPYVHGDRLRLLYWPALARRDELVVRDFEDSSHPRRLQVVADIRPRLGRHDCERVLAAVAGVGLQVLGHDVVVDLLTTTGDRVAIEPGPRGPVALLRAIAQIDTSPTGLAGRRFLRRREVVPAPIDDHLLGSHLRSALVVTTQHGAQNLPGSLAQAHLVIAP
jgi:uncharacterized protein (DUF58 family)